MEKLALQKGLSPEINAAPEDFTHLLISEFRSICTDKTVSSQDISEEYKTYMIDFPVGRYYNSVTSQTGRVFWGLIKRFSDLSEDVKTDIIQRFNAIMNFSVNLKDPILDANWIERCKETLILQYNIARYFALQLKEKRFSLFESPNDQIDPFFDTVVCLTPQQFGYHDYNKLVPDLNFAGRPKLRMDVKPLNLAMNGETSSYRHLWDICRAKITAFQGGKEVNSSDKALLFIFQLLRQKKEMLAQAMMYQEVAPENKGAIHTYYQNLDSSSFEVYEKIFAARGIALDYLKPDFPAQLKNDDFICIFRCLIEEGTLEELPKAKRFWAEHIAECNAPRYEHPDDLIVDVKAIYAYYCGFKHLETSIGFKRSRDDERFGDSTEGKRSREEEEEEPEEEEPEEEMAAAFIDLSLL